MDRSTIVCILGSITCTLIWCILTYNKLINLKNLGQEAWSGIDVQLKRRADLIPNLIECVKEYMQHERDILEKVTQLRSQALKTISISERGELEGAVSQGLSKIMLISEKYPDLKANTIFLELQKNLVETEDELQLARRYYNGTTRNFNIKIEIFPSNILAGYFGFKKLEYFQIDDVKDKQAPMVNLG